jgi:hypothetical protein
LHLESAFQHQNPPSYSPSNTTGIAEQSLLNLQLVGLGKAGRAEPKFWLSDPEHQNIRTRAKGQERQEEKEYNQERQAAGHC